MWNKSVGAVGPAIVAMSSLMMLLATTASTAEAAEAAKPDRLAFASGLKSGPAAAATPARVTSPIVTASTASPKPKLALEDSDPDPNIQAILEAYPNHHIVICLAGCEKDPGVIVYSRLRPAPRKAKINRADKPVDVPTAAGEMAKPGIGVPALQPGPVSSAPVLRPGDLAAKPQARTPAGRVEAATVPPKIDTAPSVTVPVETKAAARVADAAPAGLATPIAPPSPGATQKAEVNARAPDVSPVASDPANARVGTPVVVDSQVVCVGDCADGKGGALYLVQRFEWVTAAARTQIVASLALHQNPGSAVAGKQPDLFPPVGNGDSPAKSQPIEAEGPARPKGSKLQDRLPYDAVDVAGESSGRLWLTANARSRLAVALSQLDDGWKPRQIVMLQPSRR